jgi:hypothetical protein
MRHWRFVGYPDEQIKAAGAGRDRKMSGYNKLWSLCAVDPTGEQSAGATPRPGGKREREHGERSRKTPQIEREAK